MAWETFHVLCILPSFPANLLNLDLRLQAVSLHSDDFQHCRYGTVIRHHQRDLILLTLSM